MRRPGAPRLLLAIGIAAAICSAALAAQTAQPASAAPARPQPAAAPRPAAPKPTPQRARRQKPRTAGSIALPLSTRGREIIDSTGKRAKLRCVAWSGMQEKWYVPSGLWAQPRRAIAARIRAGGFNCVRLVYSVESVLRSGGGGLVAPAMAVAANKDLLGRTPLDVLDAVIEALENEGLMVILDNHTSDAVWCCDIKDGQGLWWNNRWPERDWLRSWDTVARRYADRPAVVGMGLRNEPRPALLSNRKLRIPTWGFGSAATDFAKAYEKAATVILEARKTYLIFAQGIMAGRDLRLARFRPLNLKANGTLVKGQLVWEVHEYPWLWAPSAAGPFDFHDYKAFKKRIDAAWGFMLDLQTAPVWLGEFGTTHDRLGITSAWWKDITQYIRERDMDWSYWTLDGQQGPSREQGREETYGLLNTTWDGWAYPPLLEALQALM